MSNYLNEFKNPSSRFRGAPFWAWNCKLEKEQLLFQLEYFKKMGLGGATIHCRTGLNTPYMGEEFMELAGDCIKKAEELDMKICLYDEDRWPSGFGGGEVTKHHDYRARYLVFTKESLDEIKGEKDNVGSNAEASKQGNGELIAKYDIQMEGGFLVTYKRLKEDEEGENVWYAYREVRGDDPWYNNQAYVDTLNKEAIECFIETTHEKYAKEFEKYFGHIIPSIFTDEPQFTHKTTLGTPEDERGAIIPYTDDFEDSYQKEYGESFLDHLPEVFWELSDDRRSVVRYRYHDHLAERFARAYSDTIGAWCQKHHIALTGHMMEEADLLSQTHALGEAMRHYRGFQIPGIDMLCDKREYTTAKQAQSAAHQMGSQEVTSEIYGVTNWDFDFRGHKQQGDWQAALGVTHRVHHLSWVSMEGEAKRDYPASISYQSPWSEKYHIIEDHFARINTALMSGKPHVRVGVIHPVESYWLYFGPKQQTADIRRQLEENFHNITEWLLFGMVDFDFISEALWNSLKDEEEGTGIRVGEMVYDVIVVPELITYRSSTVKRLKEFKRRGKTIIYMGKLGRYVDAVGSNEPLKLAEEGIQIPFEKSALLQAVSAYRDLDMFDTQGVRADKYLYQMRADHENKILFIANGKKNENPDIPRLEKYKIVLFGSYQVECLDTLTGKRYILNSEYESGKTIVSHEFYQEDSLLLYLTPTKERKTNRLKEDNPQEMKFIKRLNAVDSYQLQEGNVFMLDQAEFSLDNEPYQDSEEILRIDNLLRERLGYPLKMESYAQPWTRQAEEEEVHILSLRYRFESKLEVQGIQLATEVNEGLELFLNGNKVELQRNGYYVDESINLYQLPMIEKGINELIIKMNYHRWSNLEWNYLIGDFGVGLCGNKAMMIKRQEKIGFCDLSLQGMPFYGGNLSYFIELEVEEGDYVLDITKYRAPLLEVILDGEEKGMIFCSPSRISLGQLKKGRHQLQIISYGSRINTFGTVHNCDENETWFGPECWRTTGNSFSYEYQLKKTGILTAPILYQKLSIS